MPPLSDQTLETMFVQAMLCHTSDARADTRTDTRADARTDTSAPQLGDVTDPATLRELLVDLHMTHYSRAAKKRAWMAQIGDITFQAAQDASAEEFEAMIPGHTHTLCKRQFYALARAANKDHANGDPRKYDVFTRLSNTTVKETCMAKAKCQPDSQFFQ